jgi:peptidoglycan/LPS O-acetylase OafA/YrhL
MEKEKSYALAGLSGLMLILSYLFFLNESSGSVPIILLFAGLIVASILVLSAVTTIGK